MSPLIMSLEGPAVSPQDKVKAGLFAVTPKGVLRAGFSLTNQLEGAKETIAAWPTWMKWLVGGTAVLGVIGTGCAIYNYRRTGGNLRGRLGAASAGTRRSAEAIADFDEGHIQPGIELRSEFPRKPDAEIIELVQADIEGYRDTWKDQHGDDVEASGADLDEAFEVYKTRYVNLTRDRLRRVPRRALDGAREDKAMRKKLEGELERLYSAASYAGNTPADTARYDSLIAAKRDEIAALPSPPARKGRTKGLNVLTRAELQALSDRDQRMSPNATHLKSALAKLAAQKPLKGAKAPADCWTLAKQISKATSQAASVTDNPNLTNSEMQALHKKHRARVEKLEAQYKAQGC